MSRSISLRETRPPSSTNKRYALARIGARVRSRVAPLIDDLFQNARIGMLRNKTGAQHFDALAVISSTIDGLFRNHQQPKGIRLLNFRAYTHNSCWFSRLSTLTRKRFLGKVRQIFSTRSVDPRGRARHLPNQRRINLQAHADISESGRLSSRQAGKTASVSR